MSTHLEEILDKKKKQMEEQGKNWDAERNQWLKKTKAFSAMQAFQISGIFSGQQPSPL